MTDVQWRDEKRMLERVLAILGTANDEARRDASIAARAMPHASLRAMTDATFACYARAVATMPPAALPPSLPSFTAARVRDALGYRAWTPPSLPTALAAPHGFGDRIVRAALGIRHKWPGRVLYRLAPAALVERLRKHLGT